LTQDDQERRNTDIEEWDQKYMEVDQETLFDIILVKSKQIITKTSFTQYITLFLTGCQLP
jgi:hypothetical protein